ncbi:hypothetical protein N788_03665 [Arenimonas donghaensis DSM 18148 = HO3-R19]|uniref:Uncharacterized protein n=2 Tax=Arenimonas TaxID=490567 RepID=A0A087MIL5_9GAMM|nr:hypothetical protein N788_03665 [Arenimonas donghaensis DSM 18148 = HO3-R19]
MEANPHSNHAAELAKGVKAILKDYRTMDARIRGELIRLGFSLSEDGKHFKIVYHGDPRYMFVLPKTSSDYRAGRNAASDITGILF